MIGISYKPSFMFLCPLNKMFFSSTFILISLSFAVNNLSFVKTIVQLSSHTCPIEMSDALCSAGNTVAVCADKDNLLERGIVPCCVGKIVFLLGRVTGVPVKSLMLVRHFVSCALQ